ncbi:hypothetical protein ACE193_10485 [Bernardetia sp. OM2101]|uniref:hypothetical protein n=1 Tax=Bernardetia sp. OM2101 TaxID=3344876 RepID=UPI0035CF6232
MIEDFNQLEGYEPIKEIIQLIEDRLEDFTISSTLSKITVSKKGETQHSTAYAIFMAKGEHNFSFLPEIYQKGNHKIDIGIYDLDTDDLLFTIEAKVLPTPEGTKKQPRDIHEYVYRDKGNGAAIERFKDEFHGIDTNENLLAHNAILAYIKEGDYKHWLEKINGWIKDSNWNKESLYLKYSSKEIIIHHKIDFEDLVNKSFLIENTTENLKLKYPTRENILQSVHRRKSGATVHLHHFWIIVP